LCLLSPGGFRIEQFVTNCVGERLPCNYFYVSAVTFMSATVQCLYTLLICVGCYFYYMLSHFIVWDFTFCIIYCICSVMPFQQLVRHAASVINRRREADNISASKKTVSLLRHTYALLSYSYGITGVTDKPDGEHCYEGVQNTAGFCDMKYLPRSFSRHGRSHSKPNCFKNF